MVLPIAPSIPNLLQERASGKAPNAARGHLNPLDSGEVLQHLKASSQSPACLDHKQGGQREPKHNQQGVNPNISPFLQRLTRSEAPSMTLSPQQGQIASAPQQQQRGASPSLGPPSPAWEGKKSRPRGIGGVGALPLGCSSSHRRACLAPRAQSAVFTAGCFSNGRNPARPADFLPHILYIFNKLLIVPEV